SMRLKNQRVEVERVEPSQLGLIQFVSQSDAVAILIACQDACCGAWLDQASLHTVDKCEVSDVIGADGLALPGGPLQGILEYRLAVIIRGVDCEIRFDAEVDAML